MMSKKELLVICDLLAGQISCSAELSSFKFWLGKMMIKKIYFIFYVEKKKSTYFSRRKKFYNSGPDFF